MTTLNIQFVIVGSAENWLAFKKKKKKRTVYDYDLYWQWKVMEGVT